MWSSENSHALVRVTRRTLEQVSEMARNAWTRSPLLKDSLCASSWSVSWYRFRTAVGLCLGNGGDEVGAEGFRAAIIRFGAARVGRRCGVGFDIRL